MRTRFLAPLVPVIAGLVVAACSSKSSGGNGCTSYACTQGGAAEIQQCPGSNGATNYTFGSQSCSCLPDDPTGCDACKAQVTYFCQQGDASGSSSGGGSGSSGGDGGDDSPSLGDGPPLFDSSMPPCNLTVSGMVSGSFTCLATMTYSSLGKRSTFSIQVPDPHAFQLVQVSVQEPMMPKPGTWSSGDTGATGGITVDAAPSGSMVPSWHATAGGTVGTYTIQINVQGGMPTMGGEAFGVTGTLSATLDAVASTGATGTLTMHATF